MKEEMIITSLDKLRCVSSTISGMKQQIIQLEDLLSEARKEIIKLKGELKGGKNGTN